MIKIAEKLYMSGHLVTALALLVLCVWTPSPARAGDGDSDGIPDSLELALAQRFFPTLNLHCGRFEGTSLADRRQLYGHDVPGYTDSSNGRIPFVAHPYSPGNGVDCAEPFQCIEIRYGIAWNWDLGDDTFGGSHRGDSETYAILVARKDTDGSAWGVSWSVAKNDVGKWRLMKEFMSAHWGSTGDSSSFRGHGPSGVTGHQRVWCAEGKHAMYPSQGACNSGGVAGADDCGDSRCDIRSDVYQDVQNVGEQLATLAGTIPYPGATKNDPPSGTYHVWGGLGFGDATSYRTHFTRTLDWCRGFQYCVDDSCGHTTAECAPGDIDVGTCTQECGFGPEPGGVLCQSVRCY